MLGVEHEVAQKAKLGSGQLYFTLAVGNRLARLVQVQPCGFEQRLVRLTMRAAQQRLYTQLQLLGMEGFGHVIIGPGLKPFNPLRP